MQEQKSKKEVRDELNEIIRYFTQIFQSLGCDVKAHKAPVSSICTMEGCFTSLLCPECLLDDLEHSKLHNDKIESLNSFLETVFVKNLDQYIIDDIKISEVETFYELFWKGIKVYYKGVFEKFADDSKTVLKNILDRFAQTLDHVRERYFREFDKQLKSIKESIEISMGKLRDCNDFNVDKIVKNLLSRLSEGDRDSTISHLREIYRMKIHNDLQSLGVKIFEESRKLKSEINFEEFVPKLVLKKKTVVDDMVDNFQKILGECIFLEPAKKIFDPLLKEGKSKSMGRPSNAPMISHAEMTNTSTSEKKQIEERRSARLSNYYRRDIQLLEDDCKVLIRDGYSVIKSFGIETEKLHKLRRELDLTGHRKGKLNYYFSYQNDRKNLRTTIAKKFLPNFTFRKKFSLEIKLPNQRLRKRLRKKEEVTQDGKRVSSIMKRRSITIDPSILASLQREHLSEESKDKINSDRK